MPPAGRWESQWQGSAQFGEVVADFMSGAVTDSGGQVYNVLHPKFGAKDDGTILSDVGITIGTNILSSASYTFTVADIGKSITVNNAGRATGSSWNSLDTTITDVSGGNALLGANAVSTVPGPRTVTDGVMTLGSSMVTSATGAFTMQDIGKHVTVSGAGVGAATLTGTVSGSFFPTATTITLSRLAATAVTNATVTVPGGRAGFGTDNRVACQAAIDAAYAAGGGTVLFPIANTGVYYLSIDQATVRHLPWITGYNILAALSIKSNVTLRGTSQAATLCTGNPYQAGTQVNAILEWNGATAPAQGTVNQNNWSICDLTLDGLFIGYEGITQRAIYCAGASNVRILNCEMRYWCSSYMLNESVPSLGGPNASNQLVEGNYFHDSGGGHIAFYLGTDIAIVNNRTLSVTTSAGETTAMLGSVRVLIANNVFLDGNTIGRCGNAAKGPGSDFVIANNFVGGNAGDNAQGIDIQNGNNIAVIGNEVDMSASGRGGAVVGTGILGNSNTNCTIVGNVIRHQSPTISAAYAIQFSQPTVFTCTGIVITGNRGTNNTLGASQGSQSVPTLSNSVISNNVFDGSFGYSNYGFYGSCTLSGNQFLDLAGVGHAFIGNDNIFEGNFFSTPAASTVSILLGATGLRNRFRGGRVHHGNAGSSGTYWIQEAGVNTGGNLYEGVAFTTASTGVRQITLITNGNSIIRNCPGWNPVGPNSAATPAFPATATLIFNTSGCDVVAYVVNGASAITAISKGALPAPVNTAFTTALTGGTLADATAFYYRVSAVLRRQTNAWNIAAVETLASTETTITTGSGGGLNTVTINWLPVPGANYYKVYGRTTGAELFMANVGGQVNTFIDNGSITPAGALPGSNATSRALTGFTIPASGFQAIRLRATEGISFTFGGGAPAWIWDME